MAEKAKLTLEELQKRLGDLKEYAERTRVELEGMIKKRPVESAGVVFIAGIVVGILIGSSVARRS
jgi:ElaB/YqjD/DUF883 family membrane-anchored ribosome-binding protein